MADKNKEHKPDNIRLIDPAEYARRFNVSRMTVYRMLKANQIPGAIRVRGVWRIPEDSIPVTC